LEGLPKHLEVQPKEILQSPSTRALVSNITLQNTKSVKTKETAEVMMTNIE
jgi:hypothetical protein